MAPRRWLWGLLGLVAAAAVVGGKPAWHVARTMWRNADHRPTLPAGYVDDASRMNAMHARHVGLAGITRQDRWFYGPQND